MKGSLDVLIWTKAALRRILVYAPSVWLEPTPTPGMRPSSRADYIGKGKALAKAYANFAVAYADQSESDHQALPEVLRFGYVTVQMGS